MAKEKVILAGFDCHVIATPVEGKPGKYEVAIPGWSGLKPGDIVTPGDGVKVEPETPAKKGR